MTNTSKVTTLNQDLTEPTIAVCGVVDRTLNGRPPTSEHGMAGERRKKKTSCSEDKQVAPTHSVIERIV